MNKIKEQKLYLGNKRLIIIYLIFFIMVFSLFGQTQEVSSLDSLQGEKEMKAIAASFPGRGGQVQIRDGDWAIKIDTTWYYWAHGRFLTEDTRADWEEYVSVRFYNYEKGPQRERVINEELAQRLKEHTLGMNDDNRIRFNNFPDDLYNVHSRQEAEALMESIVFLGYRTRVHPLLVSPLARVEAKIIKEAVNKPLVRSFMDGPGQIHGYNWRNIAGTARRSYHSYGMAVDIAPRRYEKWAYWRWAVDGGVEEWWNIPIGERYQVPLSVIEAFEAEGFVWGGKWLFFDNMHFEYRPEVIILAGS